MAAEEFIGPENRRDEDGGSADGVGSKRINDFEILTSGYGDEYVGHEILLSIKAGLLALTSVVPGYEVSPWENS